MRSTRKGIIISIASGVLMGFFYRFVAASMSADFKNPEPGKLTPYTAVVIFSLGLFFSNFIWNTLFMAKPFSGAPVSFERLLHEREREASRYRHPRAAPSGMSAWPSASSPRARPASPSPMVWARARTMVAAFWGVFIWKEFKNASPGDQQAHSPDVHPLYRFLDPDRSGPGDLRGNL